MNPNHLPGPDSQAMTPLARKGLKHHRNATAAQHARLLPMRSVPPTLMQNQPVPVPPPVPPPSDPLTNP
jgi:hypothetical protein